MYFYYTRLIDKQKLHSSSIWQYYLQQVQQLWTTHAVLMYWFSSIKPLEPTLDNPEAQLSIFISSKVKWGGGETLGDTVLYR